jgi:heme-degrading monooxygenase HmoA
MYVIVWAFRVTAGREADFARIYGADGAWAALFAKGEGYLGTELLHDAEDPRCYLSLDRWTSPGAFEAFRQQWADEYASLDQACEALTESEVRLGAFTTGTNPG